MAFVLDVRLGIITWLVAAAHEVPQELGDFGLLIHSGWSPRQALAHNFASALTFLLGSLLAFAVSGTTEVTPLVAFAAGTFIYIAMADLVPQFTSQESLRMKMTTPPPSRSAWGDCSSWRWSRPKAALPGAETPHHRGWETRGRNKSSCASRPPEGRRPAERNSHG